MKEITFKEDFFDLILPSRLGADEMSVLARHSASLAGRTRIGRRTVWQLKVGLGCSYLWERECQKSGASGG